MTIPFNWDPITEETIKQAVEEANQKEMSEQGRKQIEFLKALLEMGADYILTSADGGFINSIAIQSMPFPGQELMAMSDDDLRIGIKNLFQGELAFKTEIYEISRVEVNGRPGIRIYLSHEPDKYRILNYVLPTGKNSVSIALTATVNTFPELREQFEQVIGTVKFEKNFQ